MMAMMATVPAWAMRRAAAGDYREVQDAHARGRLVIKWPDRKALRAWSRLRGWPTPWFGFEAALLAKLFESEMNFASALAESGMELHIPLREHTLSLETLRELDALYAERAPSGVPTGWRLLVLELREIRRAVAVGVVVQVEGGPRLRTPGGFYHWAHARYHALEDGSDAWIGDDR
jgi:hypothetical protein